MDRTRLIKLVTATLTSSLCLFANAGYAVATTHASVTIEDSSLDWVDAASRDKLLAVVPKWSSQAIKLVFEEYLHPERHHLPIFINGSPVNYNALFINAFWGPNVNPFVKYPRPAKIFIFIKEANGAKKYFMAPVVQDENDKNYYVFDKTQTQPIPVKLWVYNKTNGFPCAVRFNVCTGYGVQPQDTCAGKNFESEVYEYPEVTAANVNNVEKVGNAPSAIRKINQDWREKEKAMRPKKHIVGQSLLDGSSPWNDREKRNALLRSAVTWPNYKIIKDNFEKIRNIRYFQDEAVPDFTRRITWLYPDDGCWTRAAAVIKDYFGPLNNVVNNYPRPSKVFAFGNLCVNTTNSPTGRAAWWYHFAPIIRDAETNQTYVLDPSINSAAPTPVEKWMELLAANTGSCAQSSNSVTTFNVCNGYGVSPYDRCDFSPNIDFESEIRAEISQRYFRKFERDRQVELGRDPNKVLGDMPPW
jgi:hypothetical protein